MSDSIQKPVRRAANGQLLPGTASPRAKHGVRERFKAMLRGLIGDNGEKAYQGLLDIAEGRARFKKLAREPLPHEDSFAVSLIPIVEVQPSMRERIDAWIFLAEQLNGRAAQDVTASIEVNHAHTYEAMPDDKLDQLERLLREALPEKSSASSETVEAEIVDEPTAAVP